jgi:hypothetical protein
VIQSCDQIGKTSGRSSAYQAALSLPSNIQTSKNGFQLLVIQAKFKFLALHMLCMEHGLPLLHPARLRDPRRKIQPSPGLRIHGAQLQVSYAPLPSIPPLSFILSPILSFVFICFLYFFSFLSFSRWQWASDLSRQVSRAKASSPRGYASVNVPR